MKKILLLLAVVFCLSASMEVKAQYYINESFDAVTFPPTGWTTKLYLGTVNWVRSTTAPRSGAGVAFANYGPVAGNRTWLVTPQVTVTAGDSLSFWGKRQYSSNYPPDSLTIMISTTDTNRASFTQLAGYDVNTAFLQNAYSYAALSLNAYAGQTIYIAFRHFDQDGNGIYMDDVKAGKPAANPDIAITFQFPSGNVYYASGTTSAPNSVVVTNIGGGASPSVTVTRTINPGGFSGTSNVSPLNAGATATLNFTDFPFTAGVTYTIHDTAIATGGETVFTNNAATTTFTPNVAKHILLVRTDQPSVDSIYAQLTLLGVQGDVDTLTALPGNGFSAWKTVIAPFGSGATWTAAFRNIAKNFLDGSTLGDKKSLMIFGNDLGYANDPVRNTSALPADTLFYRQYLRARYIADNWFTPFSSAGAKIKGLTAPFNTIVADSVVDPYPDLVAPVNGGSAAFIPVTEDGNGDSACAVYYGSGATLYNMFYGTNVFSGYRTKSDGTLDNPTTIFGVIDAFIILNGGILPVELASFNSTINSRNVTLNWATTHEQNNSGFDIERKLTTTANWSKVGNVAGAGNSNQGRAYTFADNNLNSGKYNYRLKQMDFNGNFKYYDLSNEVIIGVPTKFELSQNYPNPFNPTTKINYDLPFDSKVAITLFDMTGREVANIVNTVQTAGSYTVNFNASTLSSGVYFYQISATGGTQNFVKTMKMMLVK